MTESEVINELVKVYQNFEEWHNHKLSEEESYKYFTQLINKQRILYYTESDQFLGYVESWRLSYEQWGRIVCHAPFSAYTEDTEHGEVAYIANTWIKKECRRGQVFRQLRDAFFRQNHDAKYYVGEALRKKTGLIKVLTKQDVLKRYGGK